MDGSLTDFSMAAFGNGIAAKLPCLPSRTDRTKDLPPYSTVYWHYKQWRAAGCIEKLMTLLHEAAREQVKKKKMDDLNYC